MRVYIPHTSTG